MTPRHDACGEAHVQGEVSVNSHSLVLAGQDMLRTGAGRVPDRSTQ